MSDRHIGQQTEPQETNGCQQEPVATQKSNQEKVAVWVAWSAAGLVVLVLLLAATSKSAIVAAVGLPLLAVFGLGFGLGWWCGRV